MFVAMLRFVSLWLGVWHCDLVYNNAVMFTNKQQPGFERARELIELHREAARNAAPDSGG